MPGMAVTRLSSGMPSTSSFSTSVSMGAQPSLVGYSHLKNAVMGISSPLARRTRMRPMRRPSSSGLMFINRKSSWLT